MEKKAQLWQFCDDSGVPLGKAVPRGDLHKHVRRFAESGQLLDTTDSRGYHTLLDAVPGSLNHFVLYNIRDDNWPYKYQQGGIQEFSDGEIDGLAEASHFLLVEGNHVVTICPGHSPRPARFAAALRHHFGWDVWMQPVLRADVAEVIANMTRVSDFELKIPTRNIANLAPLVEDESDPLSVFAAAAAGPDAVVTMRWSVGKSRSHADQNGLLRAVKSLARRDMSPFDRAVANVYVKDAGNPDQRMPVDFIQQQVVAQVDVGKPADQGAKHLTTSGAAQGLAHAFSVFRTNDHLDLRDQAERLPMPPDARS